MKGEGEGAVLTMQGFMSEHGSGKGEMVEATAQASMVKETGALLEERTITPGKQLLLELDPPELGRVLMNLKVEEGILKAHIKVENSAVKDLFSLAMPGIRSSLEKMGIKAGDFSVLYNESHGFERNRYGDSGGQQGKRQNDGEAFDTFRG